MNNNNNNNVSKKRKKSHPRRQWTTDEYEKLWDGCSSSGNRWKQISELQFNSNISATLIQNQWNSIPFRKWASSNKNAEPKAFLKAQTKAETKKIREACLDCRYIACQCAVTTQTKAETKKIWEAATAAATQKKAETKKIREAATAAATQKKAETKKIREAATDNRVSALTAKKMKEAADQKPPQGQEKWVDELGNPTPIYKYSTKEVGLINMKFSLINKKEKNEYDATTVFAIDNPVNLSLKKEQEPNLAWVKDKNMISKLQQQEQDQQEQPDSPQYINIPDDGLLPAISMTTILRTGVKLLKLKSVNDKELMVLFCQAISIRSTY